MKRWLNLLGFILVSSSSLSLVAKVSNNDIFAKHLQDDDDISLDVPSIRREQDYYSVPAAIQAIFAYFGLDIREYFTQDRLFHELDGDDASGRVIIDDHVSQYIESNINRHAPNANVAYRYNLVDRNFGVSVEEMVLFQNYIHRSLSHNQPVLFAYATSPWDTVESVSVFIGIEIDETEPGFTNYILMNPETGQRYEIAGAAIRDYTRYHRAGLIGYGYVNDGKDENEVQITIKNQEGNEDHLADYDVHKTAEISVDVTQTTSSTTTGSFRNSFNQVALDEFNGEIYNFTWRKPVTDLHLSTEKIPDDNDNWRGALIEIDRTHQWSGKAYIEGILSAQLSFSRSSLDHLILHLAIYVAGTSWNTGNWAHIWFMTGTILSLTRNK